MILAHSGSLEPPCLQQQKPENHAVDDPFPFWRSQPSRPAFSSTRGFFALMQKLCCPEAFTMNKTKQLKMQSTCQERCSVGVPKAISASVLLLDGTRGDRLLLRLQLTKIIHLSILLNLAVPSRFWMCFAFPPHPETRTPPKRGL